MAGVQPIPPMIQRQAQASASEWSTYASGINFMFWGAVLWGIALFLNLIVPFALAYIPGVAFLVVYVATAGTCTAMAAISVFFFGLLLSAAAPNTGIRVLSVIAIASSIYFCINLGNYINQTLMVNGMSGRPTVARDFTRFAASLSLLHLTVHLAVLASVFTGANYFGQERIKNQVVQLGVFVIVACSILLFITVSLGILNALLTEPRRGGRSDQTQQSVAVIYPLMVGVIAVGVFVLALTRYVSILMDYAKLIKTVAGGHTLTTAAPVPAAPLVDVRDEEGKA